MSLPRFRGVFSFFLVVLFCCSSLLVSLAQEESITHPTEVAALQSVRRKLKDPMNNLRNWKIGDPCAANWTGVVCYNSTLDDGYLHVRELDLLRLNLSGSLSPELGRLSYMKILDFMWNNISGSIPKEIGNVSSLELLNLNGNQLTGSLPEEIGYLPNLDRIQVDQNYISGPIPKSFANLDKIMHFHFNNNSISGQIPPELYRLPNLIHFLVDNNNLSGYLPPELSEMPLLRILQLDNNNFDGSTIPASYANMSNLLKLSLRNCSLQGPVPDFSRIPNLAYLDLSSNQLNGSIPSDTLSKNITAIDLSNNKLTGTIPDNFAGLPYLQRLALANNLLNGSVLSAIWLKRILNATEILIFDLQNNSLSNVTGTLDLPANVSVRLQGNPLCSNANLILFCGAPPQNDDRNQGSTNSTSNDCPKCPTPFEHPRESNVPCFCAAPLLVGYRLKSPGFSDFVPYRDEFEVYLTSGLELHLYQLDIDSFRWIKGPRLRMYLKIFPVYDALSYNPNIFNRSEVQRIRNLFTGWTIPDNDLFGPYELLNFTLLDPYKDAIASPKSGLSNGALAGIVLGAIAGAITLSALVSLFILRKRNAVSRRRAPSKISFIIDGVKCFTFEEMAMATNNFDSSSQVGEGGYGKVYKGSLADGTVVAVKRAQRTSLQGEKEFLTEIEFMSRLHHRNLVPLVGYCDEEAEQMLVYEFMSNGTLRDHLFAESKDPMSFAMRLKIALGSSKGILYLHTEADPPIFHRDIKASNILLDSKFIAKVADFGLSRLAPVPDFEGTVPAYISTVVKGTPGYIDPEYFLTHQLTDKSDVYSLGVVFLELLTGMHPITDGKNIVREVKIAHQSGMVFSLIDNGMGSYPSECVERFVSLAIKCCHDETDARPSMEEVVRELENIWRLMPESKTITKCNDDNTSPVQRYGGNDYNPSSSSSSSLSMARQHPYMSLDVSGSDLVSGVMPSIRPR